MLVEKGFRYKRYDVCHRGFVDCYSHLPIKVLQDPLKKRKYDISESIDLRGKVGLDMQRGGSVQVVRLVRFVTLVKSHLLSAD